ncbi:helix-turn-helix domain-containing protein [Streptomyces sp. NPDC058655]|uniref:helix-turn-helix domain-containing protein n=1 Tax=unclassified Streptomyces TaxID=2593676 RepID=UPI00365AA76D
MSRPHTSTGAVTGFVLRLARQSIPRTQAAMAEALGVDLNTWQGWESGRRPIAHIRVGTLLELRRRLPALGADPRLVALLDAAMDADRIIAAGLGPAGGREVGRARNGAEVGPHPLAGWVHTRDTAHMLAWALTGTAPPALAGLAPAPAARRGPVAAAPLLAPAERQVFFDRLRESAEHAAGQGERGALLHRQALYLASYDRGPEAAAWTAQALHGRRDVLARRGWSPHWAEARSTATALARLGDPQPLLDFIERALVDDDTAEAANLNYWAYWLGGYAVAQPDDAFMRDRELTGWDPVTLLRSLTGGIHLAPGYVDLYAHSVWVLVCAFPWLPQAAGRFAAPLHGKVAELLDGAGLSERSRRELGAVAYVLRQHPETGGSSR